MKKIQVVSGMIVILITLGLLGIASCLDPVSMIPDINFNISGNVSVTDITSAVFLLSNRSKSIDVTEVTISQDRNEWQAAGGQRPNIDSLTIIGMPKRAEQKAVYVQPTDISYLITVHYFDSNPKEGHEPIGEITFKAPMSIPREVYEYIIYKDFSGNIHVVYAGDINKILPDSDPEDTVKEGDIKPDISAGEGSSPAVIPPEYRNRMGTAIAVNMTNSQEIETITFTQGKKSYVMDNVNTSDKRSIALGQGDWQVWVSYNRNGVTATIGPKTIIIVPSNDPQADREHYLYFYLNDKNEYTFVTGNPPDNTSQTDILPPDTGYGSGVIMITNNSSAMVISATIRNLDEGLTRNYYFGQDFIPQIPVQYGQTGYINIIGSEDFPILANNRYLLSIDLENIDGISTMQRLVYIYNSVVHIVINQDDIHNPERQVGVTLYLTNLHPQSVITALVLEDQHGRMLAYSMNTWGNKAVGMGETVTFQVLTTSNVPIYESSFFTAHLTVQYNGTDAALKGKTAVASNIVISPNGSLYGNPAETNRFVTLNASDLVWNQVSPPGQILPSGITLRIYGINTVDPINSIILIRDTPASAGFNELSQDFCLVGGRALPHTSLPIWATGHTHVSFASYFNTSGSLGMVTRNNFYDFPRVRTAVSENRVTEITVPRGLAQDKTPYVDITMDIPKEGEGWYVFFLTSLGWVIGHTNPAFNAPNRQQNTLFWVNPHRLMANDYWIHVDHNIYQAAANGHRPRRVADGNGFRVIPIGHHINDDTTSILKRPTHLPLLGPLVHDAASTIGVNAIQN